LGGSVVVVLFGGWFDDVFDCYVVVDFVCFGLLLLFVMVLYGEYDEIVFVELSLVYVECIG